MKWIAYWRLVLVFLVLVVFVSARENKLEKDIPYKGEKLVDVSMDIGLGRVNVFPMEDSKYILRAVVSYSSDEYKPLIEYFQLGSKGRLKLKSRKQEGKKFFGFRDSGVGKNLRNEWVLNFSTLVPYDFEINLGLGSGDLDFTNMKLRDFEMSVGLSDVKVRFGEKNEEELRNFEVSTGLGNVTVYGLLNSNAEEFKVDCGMGSAVIYLRGEVQKDVTGYLTVGLGSMSVKISRKFGVELRTEKSFLSSLGLDDFYEYDHGIYRSSNWDDAQHKIILFLEVGLGSIDIGWVD